MDGIHSCIRFKIDLFLVAVVGSDWLFVCSLLISDLKGEEEGVHDGLCLVATVCIVDVIECRLVTGLDA